MSKVAFITGGSRGIGLGVAKELAEDGVNIVINGVRESSSVKGVVDNLKELAPEAIYIQGDISNNRNREDILHQIDLKFGRIDYLINNAGIAPPSRDDILDASEDSFDKVISVNLKAPFFLSKEVANYMISKQIKGSIINISSISSIVASVNRGDYCISKAGITMMTKLFAVRLAEYGINVFEIQPGIIETDMTAGAKLRYDEQINNGLTLIKRWGRSSDIGKAVRSICNNDFPYSTGNTFVIDGGLTLHRL